MIAILVGTSLKGTRDRGGGPVWFPADRGPPSRRLHASRAARLRGLRCDRINAGTHTATHACKSMQVPCKSMQPSRNTATMHARPTHHTHHHRDQRPIMFGMFGSHVEPRSRDMVSRTQPEAGSRHGVANIRFQPEANRNSVLATRCREVECNDSGRIRTYDSQAKVAQSTAEELIGYA